VFLNPARGPPVQDLDHNFFFTIDFEPQLACNYIFFRRKSSIES
jgi:hypothetical protein